MMYSSASEYYYIAEVIKTLLRVGGFVVFVLMTYRIIKYYIDKRIKVEKY